jgi:hypothetical protein
VRHFPVAAVIAALAAPPAAAQVVIDTRTGGAASTVPFGQVGEVPGNFIDDNKNGQVDEPGSLQRNHTVGQTFTVPAAATRLTAFGFTTRDARFENGVGDTERPTNFRAYVMAWDGVNNRATGPVLFQSGGQATVEDGSDQAVSFSGLTLDFSPGGTYVAFLNQDGFGLSHGSNIASNVLARDLTPGGTYAGGTLVTKSDGTPDFGGLTSEPWAVAPDRDAAFSASFTAVPEPGTLLLAGSAAVGWVAFWRRRWQPVAGGTTPESRPPPAGR